MSAISEDVRQQAHLEKETLLDDIRTLNKAGVEQMHAGALYEALATLQMAYSLTTGILRPAVTAGYEREDAAATAEHASPHGHTAIAVDDEDKDLHSVKSATLNNLGCLFKRMQRYDEAMHYLQLARTLESETSSGGPSCSTLLNLCTVLLAQGNLEESLAVAKTAAEKAETGSDRYLHVLALHNLAVTMQSSRRSEDRRHATSTMLRALQLAETHIGASHPTTKMLRAKCGVAYVPGTAAAAGENGRPEGGLAARQPRAPQSRSIATGSAGAATSRRSEVELARQAFRPLENGTPVHVPTPPNLLQSAYPVLQSSVPSAQPVSHGPATAAGQLHVLEGAQFVDEPLDLPPTKDAAAVHQLVSSEEVQMADVVAATLDSKLSLHPETSSTDTAALVVQPTASQSDAVLPPRTIAAPSSTSVSSLQLQHPAASGPAARHSATPVAPHVVFHSPAHPSAALTQHHRVEHTLVLQRTNVSLDRPPSFIRFAPRDAIPPPVPTSFADIRQELRIDRERRQQAEAELLDRHRRTGAADARGGSQSHDVFASRGVQCRVGAADKKKQRTAQEEAEERLLRDQKKREEQQARIDEARRERVEAVERERRHRAARRIQRVYRRWWQRVGYTKHIHRQQLASRSGADGPASGVSTRGNAPSNRGGGPTMAQVSRAVVRCAKKWLARTAGRRFILRLSAARKTGLAHVELMIRRIQHLWRFSLAKVRHSERARRRNEALLQIQQQDKREFASKRIQRKVRCFLAKKNLQARRAAHYWGHVVRIQRWVRRLFAMRLQAGVRAVRSHFRARAATCIQSVWRGYMGRLRATMARLRRKIDNMKAKERLRVVDMQRIGRAFVRRRQLCRAVPPIRTPPLLSSTIPVSMSAPDAHATRYAQAALERASAVAATTEEERQRIYIPIAITELAARVRTEYAQRLVPLDVLRERAAEDHQRSLELATLRRDRAARHIQRAYRRWKRLATAQTGRTIAYASRVYTRRHYEHKEAARTASESRERLRASNDLAAGAREMKDAARLEIAALEPTVRCYAARDDIRSEEERQAAVKMLKRREADVARQKHSDEVALRPPTFLTNKQLRMLAKSPLSDS